MPIRAIKIMHMKTTLFTKNLAAQSRDEMMATKETGTHIREGYKLFLG
jgi:hypothetical protein